MRLSLGKTIKDGCVVNAFVTDYFTLNRVRTNEPKRQKYETVRYVDIFTHFALSIIIPSFKTPLRNITFFGCFFTYFNQISGCRDLFFGVGI